MATPNKNGKEKEEEVAADGEKEAASFNQQKIATPNNGNENEKEVHVAAVAGEKEAASLHQQKIGNDDSMKKNNNNDDEDSKMLDAAGDLRENILVFQDESTDCAICLDSLDDPDMEVIALTTCGHRWHLECLKEQLEQAQPDPAQRLVLTGCRCAKCGSVCDHPHPALQDLTRKTDHLREKVDAVLKEQLDDGKKDDSSALEEARRKYAIYLCSHCQEPYFGGTIVCADTADGEVPPGERLCVACAPTRLQQAHCRHPLEHRGYHKWKCRYCCKVATHVCYGTVHFCQGCHDRNSEREETIRRQKYQRQWRQGSAAVSGLIEPPSCLAAIPCPGGDGCPYPKPVGATHHQNGRSAECEQVYGCAWCQSNPSAADHANEQRPGSRNFIQNSSGQLGLRHPAWQQRNPNASWQVEESDPPLNETITTNFVSTFQWCVMSQFVPLFKYARNPSQVTCEVSARYMARTDCPSVFRMEVVVLNSHRRVLAQQRTGALSAPADFWERALITVEPTPGAHALVMIVHGKDENFWAGNFGSKVTDCQVRILGEPEELERMLLPEGVNEQRCGSRNFIQNSSGQLGPRHPAWQQRNPGASWQVEQSDPPLNETITTNFVSTSQWCIMSQSVPLFKYVRNPSQITCEVSARYRARTDCPSFFRMEVEVRNSQHQVVAQQRTDVLSAPADFWERASITVEPTPGAHELHVIVHGKDRNFWAGNFGSKVTDCQVRVLGEPEELEWMLLPEGVAPENVSVGEWLRGTRAHQRQLGWWSIQLAEVILPVVCILILTWLLQ